MESLISSRSEQRKCRYFHRQASEVAYKEAVPFFRQDAAVAFARAA